MKRYRLARPAKADLDLIWQRIAGESGIENASRLIDTITDRFPRLAEMPELGTTRDHIEGGVRAFPVGNYTDFSCDSRNAGPASGVGNKVRRCSDDSAPLCAPVARLVHFPHAAGLALAKMGKLRGG